MSGMFGRGVFGEEGDIQALSAFNRIRPPEDILVPRTVTLPKIFENLDHPAPDQPEDLPYIFPVPDGYVQAVQEVNTPKATIGRVARTELAAGVVIDLMSGRIRN